MLGCNQVSKTQPPLWLWQLAGEPGSALGRNIASWWQHSQERVTFPLLSLGWISKQLKKTDSKASLETARERQKSGRFLIKIQFHKNSRASGGKGSSCPIYLLSSFRKTGESLLLEQTVGSMTRGLVFPLPNICSGFKDTTSHPHCSSPPPTLLENSCVILETFSSVTCSWATDWEAGNFVLFW